MSAAADVRNSDKEAEMPPTPDERARRIRDLRDLVSRIESDLTEGELTRGEVREGLRTILAAIIRDRVGSSLCVDPGPRNAWSEAGPLRPIQVSVASCGATRRP